MANKITLRLTSVSFAETKLYVVWSYYVFADVIFKRVCNCSTAKDRKNSTCMYVQTERTVLVRM